MVEPKPFTLEAVRCTVILPLYLKGSGDFEILNNSGYCYLYIERLKNVRHDYIGSSKYRQAKSPPLVI